MDENCVITPCEKEEYEEPIVPTPTESDLVQVYDSIEQITNPNSNHIYVVGYDTYVFDGVSFLRTDECNIQPYNGDYTVTAPSDGNLVLPTKDKLMEDDVMVEANHEIEDALLQNTAMDEYVNDRVTEVKYYGFAKSNIKVINLPNVTKIDNSAFDGINASEVEEIYIPNCVTYGVSSFQRNPKLRIVDFGKANVNTNGRINNCPMLTTLILRNENDLISPTSATSIQNCPFSPDGTGGIVYVPQNLLSRYQASSEWQQYANVLEFRPIEGSEYELEE